MFTLRRGQTSHSQICIILCWILDLCRDSTRDVSQPARIASDMDMSTAVFRAPANLDRNATDLLERRMAALDLDRSEVCEIAPQTFRGLRQVCSFCRNSDRCLRDVTFDPESAAWKDYCPNVETLMALNALPWTSRREW